MILYLSTLFNYINIFYKRHLCAPFSLIFNILDTLTQSVFIDNFFYFIHLYSFHIPIESAFDQLYSLILFDFFQFLILILIDFSLVLN